MYKIVATILGIVALGLAWVTHAKAEFHGPLLETDIMMCFAYDSQRDIEDMIQMFKDDPDTTVLEVHIPFENYDGRMEIIVQGDGFQNYNWVTWKQGMLCEVIKDTTKPEEH